MAVSAEAVAWVIVVVFPEAIALVTGALAIAQRTAERLAGLTVAVRAAASVVDLRAWGVEGASAVAVAVDTPAAVVEDLAAAVAVAAVVVVAVVVVVVNREREK